MSSNDQGPDNVIRTSGTQMQGTARAMARRPVRTLAAHGDSFGSNLVEGSLRPRGRGLPWRRRPGTWKGSSRPGRER